VTVGFSLAVLIAVLGACLHSLRTRPGEGLGLPLVAILVCVFVYIIQPLSLMRSGVLDVFLTDKQAAKGILMPALMLACFFYGWRSLRKTLQFSRVPKPSDWDAKSLWRWGLAASLAGAALELIFLARSGGVYHAFSQPHGALFADRENTAYLYMGPLWIATGMAMMVLAGARAKLRGWQRALLLLFTALMYAKAVLLASRSWVFLTTATLLAAFSLARRRPLPLSAALSVLIPGCVAALLLLGYRDVLHLGEVKADPPSLPEALVAGASLPDSGLVSRTTGFEFVYHAAILETVDATQKYHLGLNWIYVFTVHLIPRIWWPEKPYGFETPGITYRDIQETTGLVVARGAAPGLVADIYRNLGLFSVVFFFFLGRLTRRLYLRALDLDSVVAAVAYVLLYALSLSMFGQSFQAVLAPLAYAMAPVVAYRLLQGPLRNRALVRPSRVAFQASAAGKS
jgi:hypothetical protein